MKVSLMVGRIVVVGYKLGVIEGCCVGSMVGISDGNCVGPSVGDVEGTYDGVSEASFVGDGVGLVVGTEGDEEGPPEKLRAHSPLLIFNASLAKLGGYFRLKSSWLPSCSWRNVDLDMYDADAYFELPLI